MNTLLLAAANLTETDYVGFTFFIGTMAMMAATAFFLLERNSVEGKWRLSLTVSALITGIACVHYYYMRDFWISTGTSPTAFRYIDWILTVPLMCVEFYLLTKPFGAKGSTLFKLIVASIWMLVTGYIGEAAILGGGSVLWGFISTIGYLYIVYEVFAGDIRKLSQASDSPELKQAMFLLGIFITLGWSIYPIGYMTMADNWLAGAFDMNITYNLADAINKIGFGLVVYSVAKAESEKMRATKAA